MARLNALFPASIPLQGAQDFDLTPCSSGLCESIRHTVFSYIIGDEATVAQQQQMIQMRLLCWCDIPGYEQA
jgi:hypothetical protein